MLSANAVFAGGSSQSGSSGAGQIFTVKVWGGVPGENGPQASIDEFNALYRDKGIRAEYTRFVNDDNGNLQLETNLLSGDSVDVYITYGLAILNKRVDSNMAVNLTSLINRDSFDIKGFGNFADSYKVNGNYYCIPTKVDLFGIMINKNMFDAAGIPIPERWTYSQFRDIARRLTRGEGNNKVYGMFFNTQQDTKGPLDYFAAQSAGPDWMFNPDGRSARIVPVIRDTAELVNLMMNVDRSAPTHADSVTQKLSQEGMFLTGRSAMTIGPWIIRSVKDLVNFPHDFVTAFAPYPVSDNYPATHSQGGAGDMLSINPKSKNIEAAWEYVKWYSTKGMIEVAKGGRVPLYNAYNAQDVTRAFLDGAEKLLDPVTTQRVLIAPRQNYVIPAITNRAAELTAILNEELEAVFNRVKTTDQGFNDFKTRGDRILAQ
jgi:multiple sugar transport system substrate-binding protein